MKQSVLEGRGLMIGKACPGMSLGCNRGPMGTEGKQFGLSSWLSHFWLQKKNFFIRIVIFKYYYDCSAFAPNISLLCLAARCPDKALNVKSLFPSTRAH